MVQSNQQLNESIKDMKNSLSALKETVETMKNVIGQMSIQKVFKHLISKIRNLYLMLIYLSHLRIVTNLLLKTKYKVLKVYYLIELNFRAFQT